MKTKNRMRWHIVVVICVISLVASACLRIEAAPATLSPLPAEILTEDLISLPVMSADGEMIGAVDGLVVGTSSEDANYIVVRIKDIYNFGKGGGGPQDRFLVVPWSHLRIDRAGQRLFLDVDAATVTDAPQLASLPITATPSWDAEIQAFWAQQ